MPDAPHVASLTILAGPLKGHALTVEDAVDDLLVGSDPDCRFVVSLPGVSPIHARLWIDPTGATVYNTRSRGIFVNDSPVADQAPLRDGDILWLGTPGEPESVMIQFRHRKAAAWAAAASPKGGREAPAPHDPPAAVGDDWLIDELEASVASLGAPARVQPEPIAPAKPEPVRDDEPVVEAQPATVDDGFIVDEAESPAEAPPPPPPVSDENEGFFVEEVPAAAPPPAPAAVEAADEWTLSDEVPASAHAVADEPEPDTFVVDEPAPLAAAPPAIEEDVFVTDEEAIVFAAPPPPVPRVAAAPPPSPPPPARQPTPPTPVPEVRQPTPPTPVPEARPVRPRPPSARPAAARPAPRAAGGGQAVPWIAIAGGAALVLVGGGLAAMRFLGGPRLQTVEPSRARVGDQLVLRGRGFSPQVERNVVRFDGAEEGRVIAASAEQLQVEVPEIVLPAGGSKQVPITVSVEGGETGAVEVTLFQAPRLHGISPSVALPGEEVVLAGTGWASAVTVAFGEHQAQVLELTPNSIRVQVPPAVPATPGTSLPVTVSSGNDSSNAAPFVVGRLPLVTTVEPSSAMLGDVITIRGRGFPPQTSWNDVRIGGVRALVSSAVESELKVVVPWVEGPGGPVPVELRVPGSPNVGTASLTLAPPADAIGFRFTAVRFEDVVGHDHVALITALGPAFVISGSDGRSAADRAVVALARLNEAGTLLKASLTSDLEVRGLEGNPSVGLVGKPEPLLEVAHEDAAGYEEAWTGPKGSKGGQVERGQLATWWGAVARDLVLLLVRGERPRHAAALAPEGRVLLEVVAGLRPPQRETLRAVGLRVPAALRGPAEETAAAAALTLAGIWSGWESEAGDRKYVTLNFTAEGGTLTYERALSLTLPLISVEQPRRGNVRYALQGGSRARYYEGTWDGQKVRGRIFSDPERTSPVGTFELERKR
jgi:hypothetical protein